MPQDLYASEGSTADEVNTYQNEPNSPRPTPILGIDVDRGTFLRFLNEVAKGSEIGMPVYADLRDSNDDPLPVNTSLYWELIPAGFTSGLVISEEMKSIDQYNRLTISEQRDADKIDAAKFTLLAPETASGSGPVPYHDVRDVDELYLVADGPTQIDWGNSSVYIESNAVERHGRR